MDFTNSMELRKVLYKDRIEHNINDCKVLNPVTCKNESKSFPSNSHFSAVD